MKFGPIPNFCGIIFKIFFVNAQTTDNKKIAERINEIVMDQRPKSQRAFALSINADPSFFAKIAKGEKPITEAVATALAEKYGANKDWIFNGNGPKYGPGNGRMDDFRAKYIAQLEKENNYLQRLVDTNLTLVLATVRTLSVRQRGVSQVILDSLERIELEVKPKKKSAGAFVEAADRNIGQIEKEAFARDSEMPAGR